MPNKVATRGLYFQQNWWDNFTSFDTSVHNVPKFEPSPINPLFRTKLALDLLAAGVCEKCPLFKPHSSCGIGGHGASISLVFSLNRVAHIFPPLSMSRPGSRPTQDTPSNSNVFSSPPGFQINFSKVSKERERHRAPKYVDVLPFTLEEGITRPNILPFRLLFEGCRETRDGAAATGLNCKPTFIKDPDNFSYSLSFRFNNVAHVS